MSATYPALNADLRAFIAAQKIFFVGTAPLAGDGSVNLSPKGYDSVRILDDQTLLWLDLGGSGVETLAHIRENGRITLMWCAFEGAANIVRVFGKARGVTFDDAEFPELLGQFPSFTRARAIIKVDITRVTDSCGWGVPFLEFKGERDQLRRFIDHRSEEEWREKRYQSNAQSIDGLPGLTRPK